MNFKDIHLGQMIKQRVAESNVEISRICNFIKSTEEEIEKMYLEEDLPTNLLLKWSKLLEYDFFRIYSQHLILYAPVSGNQKIKLQKSTLPQFRKNIYTREVIDFILDQIGTGQLTSSEVISKYRIPKTTLNKWLSKYKD